MKTQPIPTTPPPAAPSGLVILLNSSAFRRLARHWTRHWTRLNDFSRPLLPLLHIFMLTITLLILGATIYANQHLPSWYDETSLVDPAYYRANHGVWKTRMEFDSQDLEPYAVKYPLLTGSVYLLVRICGMDFNIIRSSMLVFGLLPLVWLLWWARKKNLLESGWEIIEAAFFLACFSFFYWSIFIRPESIVLTVGVVLLLLWETGWSVALFLTALCIPLCGLHWCCLALLPIFHWLVFGGPTRKMLIVLSGCALGAIALLAFYRLSGMWPSYLLEAQRGMSPSLIQNFFSRVYQAAMNVNFSWIRLPSHAFLCAVWVFGCGGFALFANPESTLRERKTYLFAICGVASLLFTLATLAWLNDHYARLIVPVVCLLAPLLFRRLWRTQPALLFAMVFFAIYPNASVLWNYLRFSKEYRSHTSFWLDAPSLDKFLAPYLSTHDVVCADSSAYFVLRSIGAEMFPLCYAFDLSPEQIHSCSAVLLENNPSGLIAKDYSRERGTSYSKAMIALFCPQCSWDDIERTQVSPEELLSAIAAHWNCTFTEIPIPSTTMANAIQYRLFRPSFSPPPH